ncbi:MAG: SAM-dependent methyltransferase [Pseudomonadota bacterium]
MIGNSRRVDSRQLGVDHRLPELIARYRASEYQRPVAEHTREAFAWLCDQVNLVEHRLLLDSGCGTGASTRHLAGEETADPALLDVPPTLFIGVDQSAARLRSEQWGGPGRQTGNVILLRAELTDFWRLLAGAGVRLAHHYVLYPNPWPKPSQLQRRWHAHPAFAAVLELGGRLTLRTNWAAYADEFAAALSAYGHSGAKATRISPDPPMSPFENKYLASGHPLYGVCYDLG